MYTKQRFLMLLVLAGLLNFGILVASGGGPIAGVSGAPGDADCTACHFDNALNSGPESVFITAPEFIGNAISIPITLSVTNPQSAKNGFQLSIQDSAGQFQTGIQANTSDIQNNGPFHVNHTAAGNMQTAWITSWNIPTGLPNGPVTVYAAFNATNNNNSFFGDHIHTTSRRVYRSGLTSTAATWPVGFTYPLIMDIPAGAPGTYLMVVSLDTTPVNLGGAFTVPLNPFDPFVSIAFSLPSLFQNLIGPFDAMGTPLAPPQVVVPSLPGIAGLNLHFAYATFDSTFTTLTDVSNRFSATLSL